MTQPDRHPLPGRPRAAQAPSPNPSRCAGDDRPPARVCRRIGPSLAGALTALLTACAPAPEPTQPPWGSPTNTAAPDNRPMRIVSLDYCADQYVLALAAPAQILALSPDATAPFSYLREQAVGLPTLRPEVETVLLAGADLVVRSYGGGPGAGALLQQAGVTVVDIGWVSTLDDGRAQSLTARSARIAAALGNPSRGAALIADLRSRLAAVAAQRPANTPVPHDAPADQAPDSATGAGTLYLTPSGVTTGPGDLVHEMLTAAGRRNYETRPGWHSIDLEHLVHNPPARVAAAFFDSQQQPLQPWSAMRHPVARAQLRDRPTVALPGAVVACGGWFLLDAVEALAAQP